MLSNHNNSEPVYVYVHECGKRGSVAATDSLLTSPANPAPLYF